MAEEHRGAHEHERQPPILREAPNERVAVQLRSPQSHETAQGNAVGRSLERDADEPFVRAVYKVPRELRLVDELRETQHRDDTYRAQRDVGCASAASQQKREWPQQVELLL